MITQEALLNENEVQFYNKKGYFLYNKPVLPEVKFNGLKNHFNKMLKDLPEGKRPEHMDCPHFVDTKLFEWIFADEILDLVEPLIGPNIGLFATHFICKPADQSQRVPWHEDASYWKNRFHGDINIVTVWLAIDDSDESNGCMKIVPGTHIKDEISEYVNIDSEKNLFDNEIKNSENFDENAVPCILKANECSLHHAGLIHGSEANTSNRRRCGYTIRFMSTNHKYNNDSCDNFQIYLARGKNLSNSSYSDSTKIYKQAVLKSK